MFPLSAIFGAAMIALSALPAAADSTVRTSGGLMQIAPMADGLEEPWAIGFLPDGSFLITERGGVLKRFAAPGADPVAVSGLPVIYVGGQGGLLDVMIPQDFATSREVWLSYAVPQGKWAGTALGRGQLSEDGTQLVGFKSVFEMPPGSVEGDHFGSRVVEAADGSIFLTVGDRATGPVGLEAQDPLRAEGKMFHFNRDGTPATKIEGAMPGVYSLGHRNPQGAALDLDGNFWTIEHGAQGGDELNRIEEAKNYGWPVVAYGKNYDGNKIGEGQRKPGMEQPVRFWDPSIAPSGLMFYSGKLIPAWRGDVFTGSLKFDFISRTDPDSDYREEEIKSPETGRVRDVVEAPDGAIWFLSVNNGAAYRMAPAQ